MLKEAAGFEEDSTKSIEHASGASERSMSEFIEARHTISNSGHNGIILKFLEEEVPPDIRELVFSDREENSEGSLSVKALKIYIQGEAAKEFKALQKARKIVRENNNDSTPLARVPKAHISRDVEISEGFQTFLNENGASLVNRKVGIVIMDYIEGIDLATLLYKEALERTYKDGDPYSLDELKDMPFNDLHRTLGNKLQFSTPGGKSRAENERGFEEEKIKNENAEKLFTALEENGFVLPPAILEQVENTIRSFHKNSFYHNDLHERQIILKDGNLENPQTFIIDYGTASESGANPEPGKKIMDDEAIIRRLKRLTKTNEQRAKEQKDGKSFEWNERISVIPKQPRLVKRYEILYEALKRNDQEALDAQLAYSSSTDIDLKNFLAMLIMLSRENPNQRNEVMNFLSAHEYDKDKRPFYASQVRVAKEILAE